MAREIIERTWCDVCLNEDDGTRTEASEVTVAVGAAKARILAVCERHEKELVAPLVTALTEYGSIADKVKTKPGKGEGGSPAAFVCEYPGCVGKSSISEGGFAQHLYQYHNIGVVAYRSLVAGETTLTKLGLKKYVPPPDLPDVIYCEAPECAREFTGKMRKGARSSHMSKQHPEFYEKWVAERTDTEAA